MEKQDISTKESNEKSTGEETVKGSGPIAYIKGLMKKVTDRRLIIRKSSGKELIEVPLIAGVGISAVLIIIAPVLLAVASVAALVAEYRVEIVCDDSDDDDAKDE